MSERITRGELAPGVRVRDGAMALQLGVSRTPVREALLRLAREGVLESDLGRGFTVRPLSREELLDLTSILAALECLALRSSDIFPDARLRELDELNGALVNCEDAEQAMALHEEWHRLLLDGCRNQHLRPMLTSLNDARRRYLHAALRFGGRPEYWTEEHAAIVEALRQGDRAGAETLLAVHWHRSLDAQLAWLDGHTIGGKARELTRRTFVPMTRGRQPIIGRLPRPRSAPRVSAAQAPARAIRSAPRSAGPALSDESRRPD